jgi:hypothetical protein
MLKPGIPLPNLGDPEKDSGNSDAWLTADVRLMASRVLRPVLLKHCARLPSGFSGSYSVWCAEIEYQPHDQQSEQEAHQSIAAHD